MQPFVIYSIFCIHLKLEFNAPQAVGAGCFRQILKYINKFYTIINIILVHTGAF